MISPPLLQFLSLLLASGKHQQEKHSADVKDLGANLCPLLQTMILLLRNSSWLVLGLARD